MRSGYTLIELLTVFTIITFLVGLLLPSLKRSVELAHATTCKSNLRQLSLAVMMYAHDNDGWLPKTAESSTRIALDRARRQQEPGWFSYLIPTYLGDPMILRCPKDPFGYRLVGSVDRLTEPTVANYASYGVSSFIMSAGDGNLANVHRNKPRWPQNTILIADIGPDHENATRQKGKAQPVDGPTRNSSMLLWNSGFNPFAVNRNESWLTLRHGRGIQMVTVLGDVREVKTDGMLGQPIHKYYQSCANGDCTLCNELDVYHYSFSNERLFWWTGPLLPPR